MTAQDRRALQKVATALGRANHEMPSGGYRDAVQGIESDVRSVLVAATERQPMTEWDAPVRRTHRPKPAPNRMLTTREREVFEGLHAAMLRAVLPLPEEGMWRWSIEGIADAMQELIESAQAEPVAA